MNTQDYSLLLVDDEEFNRDMLSRRLSRLGYRITEAKDGQEALDFIGKQAFDLVLLDVMMPGMDGLEVLTHIRESHSLVDLPVIMATARDQGGDIVAALQLGANDYVTKPLNFPLVLARLQTQLAMSDAHKSKLFAASAAQGATGAAARPTLEVLDLHVQGASNAAATQTGSGRSTADQHARIGDYQVLEELGRGGMGIVYKARHVRMDRMVALKVIDRSYLAQATSVARFYQEIQAAARLSHVNIVLAYDASQFGDTHYFAMEFCEGEDLSRLVKRDGPLSVARACEYVRQVALGLQHAHDRGFVHRDIKPSNLILVGGGGSDRRDDVVKILDFGLALLHQPTEPKGSELTREGVVIGSTDYMAPEQWLNAHKVDGRADLYSLGCVLYYLLTGQVPFPAEEPMEKMLKHHLDEATPVEQLRAEVPLKVARVVRRLMAKKAEERYQTAGELAELLKWLAQAPLTAEAVQRNEV
jgi:CheY-like chemotaxis protein/tRNA A-37 threonylcarbamoyl transferase component Bud32